MSQNIELLWKLWHKQFMLIMEYQTRSYPGEDIFFCWKIDYPSNFKKWEKPSIQASKKDLRLPRYIIARNGTLAQLRLAKRNYFRTLNPKDPRKIWREIRYLNKSRHAIATLSQRDYVAYTDSVNLLNSILAFALTLLTHLLILESSPSVIYPELWDNGTNHHPISLLCADFIWSCACVAQNQMKSAHVPWIQTQSNSSTYPWFACISSMQLTLEEWRIHL